MNFPAALNLLARDVYSVYSSYGLTIIPLFVLMGQLACNAGVGKRLYDAAYKFLGRFPGGLAMATVAACTAFGTVCGSSPATARINSSLPSTRRMPAGLAGSAPTAATRPTSRPYWSRLTEAGAIRTSRPGTTFLASAGGRYRIASS